MKYVTHIAEGEISTSGLLGRTFTYSDDAELVTVIRRLISEGYAFMHQPHSWPPAAILEDLQDKGLLTEPFTAITWDAYGHRTFRVPEED